MGIRKVASCTGSNPLVCQRNKPIKGRIYWDPLTQEQIYYEGCKEDEYNTEIPCIFVCKAYTNDASSTTAYWSGLRGIDGTCDIRFAVNNAGIYKCVVEGWGDNGPFTADVDIEVK